MPFILGLVYIIVFGSKTFHASSSWAAVCVISRCYSVCQGNIRPHFACSSSVLAKIHFTQCLVCVHMCWRECKVISQPIHGVCVLLANQAILRCRSPKKVIKKNDIKQYKNRQREKVVIQRSYLSGNFTLRMGLHKEIQNPAALNNLNKSSTGVCRQPRETGTVCFFNFTLQSTHI